MPTSTKTQTRGRTVAGIAFALVAFPGISAAALASSEQPSTVVDVETEIGSLASPKDRGPCPPEMAKVGSSCVDKYEASLVEIQDDGTEVPFSPHMAPNGHQVRAVSQPGVIPQAHISMVEAKRACAASGKRLCRAAEWKTACKGPEATRYPYGDHRVPSACVDTNRTSPMTVLHGGEHTAKTLNDPRANELDNTVAPTGSASECTNGYGVHDMVGNVHEWTDDASFRGGYYLDTKLNGEGCDYRTTAHAPAYYDYSTGFRCCSDAAE